MPRPSTGRTRMMVWLRPETVDPWVEPGGSRSDAIRGLVADGLTWRRLQGRRPRESSPPAATGPGRRATSSGAPYGPDTDLTGPTPRSDP